MTTAIELKSVLATNDAGVARLLTTLGTKNGLVTVVSAEVPEVRNPDTGEITQAFVAAVTTPRDATIAEVVEELHTLTRVHIVYPVEKVAREAAIAAKVEW